MQHCATVCVKFATLCMACTLTTFVKELQPRLLLNGIENPMLPSVVMHV